MRRRALLATTLLATAASIPAHAQGLLERLAGTGTGANAFVQVAAISDNFEIESSRVVLARSTHPQIREFAQRMIEHHTMISTEMRALPEATTRLPANLDERHTNMLLLLRQQEDVDMLNRYYVQQQIEGHTEAVTAYEAYANGGDVPALKAFAQRHLPMIRQHLQMARALQAPQGG
jgi:putative membrane protein